MDMINGLDILEKAARKDNLQEFYNTIVTFTQQNQGATLQSFLEEMALVSAVDNLDENEQTVTLMTMHCAKGLEFDKMCIRDSGCPTQRQAGRTARSDRFLQLVLSVHHGRRKDDHARGRQPQRLL